MSQSRARLWQRALLRWGTWWDDKTVRPRSRPTYYSSVILRSSSSTSISEADSDIELGRVSTYRWDAILRWGWSLSCRRYCCPWAEGQSRSRRTSTNRTSSRTAGRRTETTWCRSYTCSGKVREVPRDSRRSTIRPRSSETYCRCPHRHWTQNHVMFDHSKDHWQ